MQDTGLSRCGCGRGDAFSANGGRHSLIHGRHGLSDMEPNTMTFRDGLGDGAGGVGCIDATAISDERPP